MNDFADLPDVSLLAIPVYVVLLAIEFALIRRGGFGGRFEVRDTATSLAMGLGSVVSDALLGFISAAVLLAAWEFRVATFPIALWSFALCFVLNDLRYYWSHRLSHRSRWFWANHVVHHSSQHYNLGTALRQPWTNSLCGLVVLYVPLVLVGFHPAVLVSTFGLNLFYQFWIHTETIRKLPPWFEWLFNTPSHHRVHHAINPRYLDANYAGVFMIWDRLFGSFVPERDDDPVEYGLTHQIETYHPVRVSFDEYVAITRDVLRAGLGARERFAYLFRPPGWSHDGSRRTTAEVKADFVREHPDEAGAPGLPTMATATRS